MEIVLILIWAGVAAAFAILTVNEWRKTPGLIPEGGVFVGLVCCLLWPVAMPALMLYLWIHLARTVGGPALRADGGAVEKS